MAGTGFSECSRVGKAATPGVNRFLLVFLYFADSKRLNSICERGGIAPAISGKSVKYNPLIGCVRHKLNV